MRNRKRWLAVLMAATMAVTSVVTSPLTGAEIVYAAITIETEIPDQLQNGVNPPDLMKEPALATITLSDGTTLTRGTDFTVATTDVAVGNATATFTGKANSKWPAGLAAINKAFKIVSSAVSPTDTYEVVEQKEAAYDGDQLKASEIDGLDLVIKNGIEKKTIGTARGSEGDVYAKVDPVDANKTTGDAGEKYTVKIIVSGATSDKDKEIYSKVVTIQKKNIKDLTAGNIAVNNVTAYDGTAQTTTFSSTKGAKNEDISADIEITKYSNNTNATTTTSKAVATVSAKATSKNYTGSVDCKFDIGKFDLSGATVLATVKNSSVEYTGSKLDGGVSVEVYTSGALGAKKIPATDYKVVLSNNVDKGIAKYALEPTNTGNLENNKAAASAFNITQADFTKISVEQIKDIEVGTLATVINSAKADYFKVTYLGKAVPAADYEITAADDGTVGEGKVTFTSTNGNFNNLKTVEAKVKVVAKKMAEKYTSTATFDYTGEAIKPLASQVAAGTTLSANVDYEIVADSYSNNLNVGTATVKIKGIGAYAGQTSVVEFKIVPKEIYNASYTYTVLGLSSGIYSEGSKIPNATVKVTKTSDSSLITTLSAEDCDVTVKTITGNKITAVIVKAKRNYKNETAIEPTVDVAVDKVNLANATVTAKVPAGLTAYTAAKIGDYITVSVGGNVVAAESYTVADLSASNTDVVGKEFDVVISSASGKNTTGSKTVKAKLVAGDIAIFDVVGTTVAGGGAYSGEGKTPAVTMDNLTNVEAVAKDTDYKLTYANNINAGTATVTVTGIGKYTGSFTREFTISKLDISGLSGTDNVNLPSTADRTYRGEAFDLSSKISLKAASGEKYVFSASDYTVKKDTTVEADNETPALYATGATVDYTVTAAENSKNYTGTLATSYEITKKNVEAKDIKVELEKSEIDITPAVNATDVKALVKKVVVDGKELVVTTDYDLTVEGTLTDVTSKDNKTFIHVALKGNYAGATNVDFTIKEVEVDLSKVVLKAPTNLVFDNATKAATAYDPYASATGKYAIEYKNAKGEKIAAAAVMNAGKYTATVVGATNYKGINGASVTFEITPYVISDAEWKALEVWVNTTKNADVPYLGAETKFALAMKTNGLSSLGFDEDDLEVKSFDSVWNEDNEQIVKLGLKADRNFVYNGEDKEITFSYAKGTLTKAIVEEILYIADQEYTGSAIVPEIKVKDGCGLDPKYIKIVRCRQNVAVSQKTAEVDIEVTVPADDDRYDATVTPVAATLSFNIVAKSIANATVEGIENVTYTGKAVCPDLTVTMADGKILAKGQDYAVSYKNNVNVGTATVTIKGIGNYAGTITKTFEISRVSISGATVSDIAKVTYTGKALTPEFTVTLAGKTLAKDKDYSVAFKNNKNAGTATATITGIGNYSGTVTKTFTIAKAEQSITKAISKKTLKAKTLKTKKLTFKVGAKANGKLTYSKKSGNKSIKVAKDGTVTVAKGTKKGTYKVVVTIKAAATANYKAKTVTKTITITVK